MVDREDNDAPYNPINCRLVTRTIQNRNIRVNRMITYRNETKCLAEWCEELGVNYKTAHTRLSSGYTLDEVFRV